MLSKELLRTTFGLPRAPFLTRTESPVWLKGAVGVHARYCMSCAGFNSPDNAGVLPGFQQ